MPSSPKQNRLFRTDSPLGGSVRSGRSILTVGGILFFIGLLPASISGQGVSQCTYYQSIFPKCIGNTSSVVPCFSPPRVRKQCSSTYTELATGDYINDFYTVDINLTINTCVFGTGYQCGTTSNPCICFTTSRLCGEVWTYRLNHKQADKWCVNETCVSTPSSYTCYSTNPDAPNSQPDELLSEEFRDINTCRLCRSGPPVE